MKIDECKKRIEDEFNSNMETANHECYVSIEVAKLLKEVGFDWKTRGYYTDNKYNGKSILFYGYNNSTTNWNAKQFFMRGTDGSIYVNNGTYLDSITGDYITSTFLSAPTLEVAQRWLREVKSIEAVPWRWPTKVLFVSGYKPWSYRIIVYRDLENVDIDDFNASGEDYFKTYEEAQEAGIKKALELILEKGE